jgi:hypothetical protein
MIEKESDDEGEQSTKRRTFQLNALAVTRREAEARQSAVSVSGTRPRSARDSD